MTDESIMALSDETKAMMRNYMIMAGFFILAMLTMNMLLAPDAPATWVSVTMATFLMTVAIILAMLHKRDMFAMYFMLMSLVMVFYKTFGNEGLAIPLGITQLVMAIAFLQSRNEQRTIVVFLLLLAAVGNILGGWMPGLFIAAMNWLLAACYAYFAICIGCEKMDLPLRSMMVADEVNPDNDGEPVHFKIAGSSIGFALMAFCSLAFMFAFMGMVQFGEVSLDKIVGCLMTIIGVVMMVAGRMKGTPAHFICIGLILLICDPFHNPIPCIVGALLLALMLMLRKDSRILFALLLVFFAGAIACQAMGLPMVVSIVSDLVAFAIGTYIVFAVNSNGRLKLI